MGGKTFLTLALTVVLAISSQQARAADILYFTSTPDSWIGQGQTLTINAVSASRYYSLGAYTNAVMLSGGGYTLTLVEPNHTLPTVGFYDNVTRWPFMGSGAGMAFTAPGRGDNEVSGWFDVLQADYSEADGSVLAFAVDFKQYDERSTTNWTRGSIRYHSLIPVPEPAIAGFAALGVAALATRRMRRA